MIGLPGRFATRTSSYPDLLHTSNALMTKLGKYGS